MPAAPAHPGSSEALLKRLHEKGIPTDEEYNELLSQETAAVATPAPQGSPAGAMASAESALDASRLVKAMDGGVGLQVGPAAIKFSGSIIGFYVHGSEKRGNAPVVGGGVGASGNSNSVRDGLLPGFLKVDVTTQQAGLDIGAHFGMYSGSTAPPMVRRAPTTATSRPRSPPPHSTFARLHDDRRIHPHQSRGA